MNEGPVESSGGGQERRAVRVSLTFEDFRSFITQYASHVSMGGMFIGTRTPLPPGTLCKLDVRLKSGDSLIEGLGEVVWTRDRAQGPERPPGMGVRFRELQDGSRDLVFAIVDRRLVEGGHVFELEDTGDEAVPDLQQLLRLAEEHRQEAEERTGPQPAEEASFSTSTFDQGMVDEAEAHPEADPPAAEEPDPPSLADPAGGSPPEGGPSEKDSSEEDPSPAAAAQDFTASASPAFDDNLFDESVFDEEDFEEEALETDSADDTIFDESVFDEDLDEAGFVDLEGGGDELTGVTGATTTGVTAVGNIESGSLDRVKAGLETAGPGAQGFDEVDFENRDKRVLSELYPGMAERLQGTGETETESTEEVLTSLHEPAPPAKGVDPKTEPEEGDLHDRRLDELIPPVDAPPGPAEEDATAALPAVAVPSGPAPSEAPPPEATPPEPVRMDEVAWDVPREEGGSGYAASAGGSRKLWWWLIPVVLLIAAGLYFFLLQSDADGDGDVAPPVAEGAGSRDPAPPVTPVGDSGSTPGPVSTAEPEGSTATEPPVTVVSPDPSLAPSPPASPDAAPPDTASPDTASPAPPTEPAASPAPAEPASGSPMTLLQDVSWEEVEGGTQVTLTADGAVVSGAYRHTRIGSGEPRLLVRLLGIQQNPRQGNIDVGTEELRGIRIGYHPKAGGNEVHVVMDLGGPAVDAAQIEAQGNRLRVLLSSAP